MRGPSSHLTWNDPDMNVSLVIFHLVNGMPIPNNIQCLFNKRHRFRSSRSQCQYMYEIVCAFPDF